MYNCPQRSKNIPTRIFKLESDHIKNLRLQGTTVRTRISFSFETPVGKGSIWNEFPLGKTVGNGEPGRGQKALGLNARSNRLPPTRARALADHGRLVRGNTEGLRAHLPCGSLFCCLLSAKKGKFSGVSQTPADTLSHVKLINCVERSPEDVPLAF